VNFIHGFVANLGENSTNRQIWLQNFKCTGNQIEEEGSRRSGKTQYEVLGKPRIVQNVVLLRSLHCLHCIAYTTLYWYVVVQYILSKNSLQLGKKIFFVHKEFFLRSGKGQGRRTVTWVHKSRGPYLLLKDARFFMKLLKKAYSETILLKRAYSETILLTRVYSGNQHCLQEGGGVTQYWWGRRKLLAYRVHSKGAYLFTNFIARCLAYRA